MQKDTRDKKHAEIARQVRLAKKKMFANSRSGMDLREAADEFLVDAGSRLRSILSAEQKPEPGRDVDEPEDGEAKNAPLRLADSPEDWRQLENNVTRLVDDLCEHGDYDQAQSLFRLLDLLGNEDYDHLDRGILSRVAMVRAFTMTHAFENAKKASIASLRQIGSLREVSHA